MIAQRPDSNPETTRDRVATEQREITTRVGSKLVTQQPQTTFGRFHPSDACVEFPLLLLDEELAELEQSARFAQRTIGQMIRQALGLYLTAVRDQCNDEDGWGDFQPDAPFVGPDVLAVTLLLPASGLAELEAVAARRDAPASTLIRHVIYFALLGRSTRQSPPNES
jgi:hypothetical protein